jgi:hypothetical protein
MNQFKKHIPNCVSLSKKPPVFEFSTLEELCTHLQVEQHELRYSENHILKMSEDEREWRVLGSTTYIVEGIAKWRGAFYKVIEVDSIHGCGLDSFSPKKIGEPFEVRSDEIKYCYGSKTIAYELKNGKNAINAY